MTNKITIIPDVHGRDFWKQTKNDEKLIFLGDYLDPYPRENISIETAIDNFKEIINLKKNRPEIILLFGNHDYHYLNEHLNASRKCTWLYEEIHKLYIDNIELFKIAHYETYENETVVFSHAGFHKAWIDFHSALFKVDDDTPIYNEILIKNVIPILNEKFTEFDNKYNPLWNVSWYRGGSTTYGSCIWADAQEYLNRKDNFTDVYQIFGHTQLASEPIVTQNYACLDVRRPFTYRDNDIFEYETSE